MNRICATILTRASKILLSTHLRSNLFAIRSWDIPGPEPFKIPTDAAMGTSRVLTKHARNCSTRASLDSDTCKKDGNDTKSIMSGYWVVSRSSFTKAVRSVWKWDRSQVQPLKEKIAELERDKVELQAMMEKFEENARLYAKMNQRL